MNSATFSGHYFYVTLWMAVLVSAQRARGQDDDRKISLADGKLTISAPFDWQKKQPRVRIVEYEFAIPRAADDPADGRVTIMGAGGGVDANIRRWLGQFKSPRVNSPGEQSAARQTEINGQRVHVVDISGTFLERRGPFAPATPRQNYRMFGAIIVTDKLGSYFIKGVGPSNTMGANEEKFHAMLESLKISP